VEGNIITPNVPNAISIVVMATVGGAILALLRKGILSRRAGAADA
jgi:hypothetical protein